MFYEPEVSLSFKDDTKWSYNFSFSNRDLVYEMEEYHFHALYLDFSHFTNYEVGLYGKLSLGIKIRSLEIFDEWAHDEIRLTGQYGYSRKYGNLKIAHRLRFEQRLQETTGYRTRYRFSVDLPLGGEKTNSGEFFLSLKTETLFSFREAAVPELDQRLGADLGYQLFDNTEISLGLEYQYDDYAHDPQPELFLYTGLSVEL